MVQDDSAPNKVPTLIAQTLIVSHMLVDCVRTAHSVAFSYKHIGASFEDMFVSFAVLIGTAEGRPMSATKLAGYLGMPRTNVLRALAKLQKQKFVYRVGYAYLTDLDLLSGRAAKVMAKHAKIIARAHAELEKLKTSN
jgi:biotin operon repressor